MLQFENLSMFLSRRGTYFKSDVLEKIEYLKSTLGIPFNMDDGPWIAGGSIIRLVLGKDLGESDLDVFLSKSFNESSREFIHLDKHLKQILSKNKLKRRSLYGSSGKVETTYAYSYQTEIGKLQLIHRAKYESPYELLGDFDFTICQFATDGQTIAFPEKALDDLDNRRLCIHMVRPSRTFITRFYKYASLGFVPIPGESLKIHQIMREFND